MLFPWIVFGFLLFLGGVWGQKREANACYGTPGCNFMQLSCSNSGRIFILKLLYGSKISNNTCSQTQTCASPCCQPEASDCFSNYTDLMFGLVYTQHSCWNSTLCISQVSRSLTLCSGHTPFSTYSLADYSCLGSEEITDFHRNTTVTAPAVAVRYDASDVTNYPVAMGDSQTWNCQVYTTDCVQRLADVILVKENYTAGNPNGCSSVGWSGGPFLPCVPQFQYLSFNTSTPFHVSLHVVQTRRDPNGWAVVRGQDGSNIVVTCGYANLGVIPACSSISTVALNTPTRPTVTSPYTTTFASIFTKPVTSQNTSAPSTKADVIVSVTTSSTPVRPSSTSSEDRGSGREMTGVAIAGWVLAAVVILLFVVFSVLLLRRHGGCRGILQYLRGKPSSSHPATSRDQNVDVNYLHVIPDPAYASRHASPAPVYVNATSRQNASDSEYVNASSEQSRPASQHEYSPLEWSRDPARTYAELRKT